MPVNFDKGTRHRQRDVSVQFVNLERKTSSLVSGLTGYGRQLDKPCCYNVYFDQPVRVSHVDHHFSFSPSCCSPPH